MAMLEYDDNDGDFREPWEREIAILREQIATRDAMLKEQLGVRDREIARLREIILNALRTLSNDPIDHGRQIDWSTAGEVLQSWIEGHDQRREEAMVEAERLRAIVEPLDRLRADEGHSVEFHHDNADYNGLPNCCVGVVGDWTEWKRRLFYGDTVAACLKAAEEARAAT